MASLTTHSIVSTPPSSDTLAPESTIPDFPSPPQAHSRVPTPPSSDTLAPESTVPDSPSPSQALSINQEFEEDSDDSDNQPSPGSEDTESMISGHAEGMKTPALLLCFVVWVL